MPDSLVPVPPLAPVPPPPEFWPTTDWHMLENGKIQCDVCPRECQLQEGQRGLCFVRMRQEDAVVLTTYGRSSGFCIDPIEKKPLNHFLPGTPVLSFGTAGCNLTCKFCQNWEISKSRDMDRIARIATPELIADWAEEKGCRSVAFTYNDPTIFMEYAIDSAIACHERGIKTVAVTAGYINEGPREKFYRHIDAANIDLKAFTEEFYHTLTGSHLGPVLDTLRYLKHETDVWFEITTLLIPDENDSDAEIHALTEWVRDELGPDVPVHFSAFHPDFKMQDKSRTPQETLLRARRIGLENGLHYVYVGNTHHKTGASTYCHNCQHILIGRDWYLLSDWHLDGQGRCRHCGEPCAGVFDGPPGQWGRKRVPL